MNKVLRPIQKRDDYEKQFDIVKYPDGSVARQLESVSRQRVSPGFQGGYPRSPQPVYPTNNVRRPVMPRASDKALPVRKYEDDILFTRLQGISGNNNENLSEAELLKIKADVERASRQELKERRRYLYDSINGNSDQEEEDDGNEFI